MIEGKTALGLIPARGGSKGLPGKNIRPMLGRPLIEWTIEAALTSAHLDRVIVSTDSSEIAAIAEAAGAEVPFLRPPELATDEAPTIDVVEHLLETLQNEEGTTYDYVVLLEPTSPLREPGDVDGMLARLEAAADRFDSIVSVGQVGEHPSIMKRLDGETIQPFSPELATALRRQGNEPAYFPYGVAYITKTAALRAERTFYTRRSTYYVIQRHQNYEVDDFYDFLVVEAVMRHVRGGQ